MGDACVAEVYVCDWLVVRGGACGGDTDEQKACEGEYDRDTQQYSFAYGYHVLCCVVVVVSW